MKTTSALSRHPEETLVDFLDREFGKESLADLSGGDADAVPWRCWSRALYAPVREFLGRPGKQFRGEVLNLFYELGTRKDAPPEELAVAVEALHAGSLVIDDIEDGSSERRGAPSLHRLCGTPVAINAGNWLYFWPFRLLEQSPLSDEAKSKAHRLTTQVLLECHYGQALDLSVRMNELGQAEVPQFVRALTRLKTGSLVGLSAGLGALAGDASDEVGALAVQAGRELGIGLQMLNDLVALGDDEGFAKGYEDLRSDRPTWVWSELATSLDSEDYAELRTMAVDVRNGANPAPLAKRLHTLVMPRGKERVHEWFEAVILRLARVTPAHFQAALRREIERLERGYV